MDNQRAYALFDVQGMDADKRSFSGWATTPTPDRYGDTIDPLGAKFQNPLPLLHQHWHSSPIGLVRFDKPTSKGIKFVAEIPSIDDPGPLKDRVDTAWGEIKHGLVRAVSIGFRSLKHAYKEDGGIEFMEIEVYELSAVTIPANSEALIESVKSMNGRLSRETIAQIKSLDHGARRTGPVSLISPQSKTLNGAVRLIRP